MRLEWLCYRVYTWFGFYNDLSTALGIWRLRTNSRLVLAAAVFPEIPRCAPNTRDCWVPALFKASVLNILRDPYFLNETRTIFMQLVT